jgi:SET domain-containing protein
MLCVKTKIKVSKISGIGLFADEFIAKSALVWKFEPSLDILISNKEIAKFSHSAREQFYNYAFLDKTHGKYMLCGDDGRFFNHSENPNCDDGLPDITVALKDILQGEELTVNYRSFYGDIEKHPEIG